MALVPCILGKFLGVVCHCFPPRLEVLTFAARCLHVRNNARDPSSEMWNYGRESVSGNFVSSSRHYGSFTCLKSTTWDRRLYFPSEGFFSPLKIRRFPFEPANLGTQGQHATPRPPKSLMYIYEHKKS